jgi:hypothetical protein
MTFEFIVISKWLILAVMYVSGAKYIGKNNIEKRAEREGKYNRTEKKNTTPDKQRKKIGGGAIGIQYSLFLQTTTLRANRHKITS